MQEVSKVLRQRGEAIEASRQAWFENTRRITLKEEAKCIAEIDEDIVALVPLKNWIEAHTTER